MKKLISALFIATFFIPVFARNYEKTFDFSLSKPELTVTANLGIPFLTDQKRDCPKFFAEAGLNFSQLNLEAGIQQTGTKTDISFAAIYWPKLFGILNVGPGFKYHFFNHNSDFTEHDILAGLYIAYHGPVLTFFSQGSFFTKISNIPALATAQCVLNSSLQLNINFYWKVTELTDVYFLVESSTFYDYFLFCTPIFTTGAEYKIMNNVALGSNLEVTLIDMFTVSSSITQITMNLYAKVRIF